MQSISYLSKLENGELLPGPSLFYGLGKSYGVTKEWLMEDAGPPPEVNGRRQERRQPEIRDRAAAYSVGPRPAPTDTTSILRFALDKDILARAAEVSRAAKCSLAEALAFLYERQEKCP